MHEAGLHHAKVNMRNSEAVAYRLLPKDMSSDAACAASWWLRMEHKPLGPYGAHPLWTSEPRCKLHFATDRHECSKFEVKCVLYFDDYQNPTIYRYSHRLPKSQLIPTPERLVRLVADNHPLALAKAMESS